MTNMIKAKCTYLYKTCIWR